MPCDETRASHTMSKGSERPRYQRKRVRTCSVSVVLWIWQARRCMLCACSHQRVRVEKSSNQILITVSFKNLSERQQEGTGGHRDYEPL